MSTESYGLKISLPGYDVNSATPEQCSVHSHYDSFKIALNAPSPLEGNITVSFTSTPVAGTYPILTINTGYDYIPAFYLYFSVRNSTALLGQEVGNFFSVDEAEAAYFQADVQPNTITFSLVTDGTDPFYQIDPITEDITWDSFAFRYYVFAEDGI